MTPSIISSSNPEIPERVRSVPAADLFIRSDVIDDMLLHADLGLCKNQEIMGLIAGRFYRDSGGVYAVAEKAVSVMSEGDECSVVFGEEGLRQLIDEIDCLEPDEAIVGWYHSHLGIGCFMSQTDITTQDGLFGGEYGFAVVVDPEKMELAFFDSNPGDPKPARVIVME